MELTVNHTYTHPADEVFDVLMDFDLVQQKYEALGHGDVELISRDVADDGGVTLVTRRVVPLELPGFAKRFLSPRQSVTQTDEWSGPDAKGVRTGAFEVVGKGTPVQIRGDMRLAPKGKRGCTNDMTVTISCSVPLIGGKLAGFVSGDTRRALDHEQVWVKDHLATR